MYFFMVQGEKWLNEKKKITGQKGKRREKGEGKNIIQRGGWRK